LNTAVQTQPTTATATATMTATRPNLSLNTPWRHRERHHPNGSGTSGCRCVWSDSFGIRALQANRSEFRPDLSGNRRKIGRNSSFLFLVFSATNFASKMCRIGAKADKKLPKNGRNFAKSGRYEPSRGREKNQEEKR